MQTTRTVPTRKSSASVTASDCTIGNTTSTKTEFSYRLRSLLLINSTPAQRRHTCHALAVINEQAESQQERLLPPMTLIGFPGKSIQSKTRQFPAELAKASLRRLSRFAKRSCRLRTVLLNCLDQPDRNATLPSSLPELSPRDALFSQPRARSER